MRLSARTVISPPTVSAAWPRQPLGGPACHLLVAAGRAGHLAPLREHGLVPHKVAGHPHAVTGVVGVQFELDVELVAGGAPTSLVAVELA